MTEKDGQFATYTVVDSIESVAGAGVFRGYVIRSANIDSLPAGMGVRFRVEYKASGNGTTSAVAIINHLIYSFGST